MATCVARIVALGARIRPSAPTAPRDLCLADEFTIDIDRSKDNNGRLISQQQEWEDWNGRGFHNMKKDVLATRGRSTSAVSGLGIRDC